KNLYLVVVQLNGWIGLLGAVAKSQNFIFSIISFIVRANEIARYRLETMGLVPSKCLVASLLIPLKIN
ncbi:MAG: hypothetical protein ACPGLV_13095, partial [Bacteroidia bacterium]